MSLEDTLQWGHLAGLVDPKHLAHGARGHLTCEAVDVDFLIFVLLAHGVVAFLQGPTEVEKSHKSRGRSLESLSPPPAPGGHPRSMTQALSGGLSQTLFFPSSEDPGPGKPMTPRLGFKVMELALGLASTGHGKDCRIPESF